MSAADAGFLVLGSLIVLLVAGDAIVTILHSDLTGPLAKGVQHAVWRVLLLAARRIRRGRRALLASAAPVLVVATLGMWVCTMVLGFSLVFYAGGDGYLIDGRPGSLTFDDALYYAGGTVAILGFGDITPQDTLQRMLSSAAAAMGFALFTGTVTYLIELTESIGERHRLTSMAYTESEEAGRGSALVRAALDIEDPVHLRDRVEALTSHVHDLRDRIHRYTVVVLLHRSRDPVYDLEPALQICAEVAAAGHLTTSSGAWRTAAPAVRHLDRALGRLADTTAAAHLGRRAGEEIARAEPGAAERERLEVLRSDLGAGGEGREGEEAALAVLARTGRFLEELDRLTAWRSAGRSADPR
ncbi:hypothetical protein SUDANB121_00961 [Nocardiopsis dassonvillei]|uniref:potassium channel family protein n=1 Tax=Nocardiopsis dassonvillei TaxID=2014 RepID=UPI003F55542A